jgi:hypothetical protein
MHEIRELEKSFSLKSCLLPQNRNMALYSQFLIKAESLHTCLMSAGDYLNAEMLSLLTSGIQEISSCQVTSKINSFGPEKIESDLNGTMKAFWAFFDSVEDSYSKMEVYSGKRTLGRESYLGSPTSHENSFAHTLATNSEVSVIAEKAFSKIHELILDEEQGKCSVDAANKVDVDFATLISGGKAAPPSERFHLLSNEISSNLSLFADAVRRNAATDEIETIKKTVKETIMEMCQSCSQPVETFRGSQLSQFLKVPGMFKIFIFHYYLHFAFLP